MSDQEHTGHDCSHDEVRQPITEELQAQLRIERWRTGLSPASLLKHSAAAPEGLNARALFNWMHGTVKTAPAQHLQFVMQAYRSFESIRPPHPDMAHSDYRPPKAQRHRAAPRRTLSAEDINALQFEKERSGHSVYALLRGVKDAPQGLSSSVVRQWLNGNTRTAREDHYAYALERWRSLPDASIKHVPAPKTRLPVIPPSVLTQLRAERERTGLGASRLLDDATDKPAALKPPMVAGWLSGTIKTAKPEHLEYVLKRYARMETYIEITDELVDLIAQAISCTGGNKKLIERFEHKPEFLNAPKLSRILNRYDLGINAKTAQYITAECKRILADQG